MPQTGYPVRWGLLSLFGFSGFVFFSVFVFDRLTMPNILIISKNLRFVKMVARMRGCLKMRTTKIAMSSVGRRGKIFI
jgi:hypothetical protein